MVPFFSIFNCRLYTSRLQSVHKPKLHISTMHNTRLKTAILHHVLCRAPLVSCCVPIWAGRTARWWPSTASHLWRRNSRNYSTRWQAAFNRKLLSHLFSVLCTIPAPLSRKSCSCPTVWVPRSRPPALLLPPAPSFS